VDGHLSDEEVEPEKKTMQKVIRDAVHGDIELGALEMELIDTPEFQRLRGIKQLGTAYLIYPSAMHTRFEHSVGTAWMAHRLVEAVRRNVSVSEAEEGVIRAAALLHDITHIPFGHTLEDERRVLPRHDQDADRFAYFLEDSSVGDVLRKHGVKDAVIAILSGTAGFASDIVSGAISADLLDYLRRDTYFCGLRQYYDDRIFQSFDEEDGRLIVRLEKHGMLRRDALSELVNLLRIRYTLSERVYFHHTKLASGAMISKAVELALADGFDAVRLRTLKDDTLLWLLRQEFPKHAGIGHILDRLETRKLYKPCFLLTVSVGEEKQKGLEQRFHFNPSERETAERAIAEATGLRPHQVIVYCPSLGMSLPEAEVPARLDGGKIQPLSGANNAEIRILKEKHRALWKFLVLVDRSAWDSSEALRSASEEYFGVTPE
jgi:HD superfamily phosphohydrolase